MGLTKAVLLLCLGISSSSSLGLPPVFDITRLESEDSNCQVDLQALRKGLDTGQLWAQTMWDAGVKAPVGLLSETAVQFGDFDECLTITTPISSQYCLVDVSPTEQNISSWAPFKWGICVPASCSAQTLETSLQTYMDLDTAPENRKKVKIMQEACTTKESATISITRADVIFCAVMAIISLAVFIATIYDVRQRPTYDVIASPNSLIECLSARRGLHNLSRPDQHIHGVNLGMFHGLHVLASFVILFGHRLYCHIFLMHLTNYRDVDQVFFHGSWLSLWVCHFDLFVDMCFFMSAFILSFMYYGELQKQVISPLMIYVYRISRILPVYAVIVFFYATLLPQMGDGPMWNIIMKGEQAKCKNNWWTNLLFVSNFVEVEHLCMSQTWYTSCDFQLFMFSTLIVFMLHQTPRLGVVITVVVSIATTMANFLGTHLYHRPGMHVLSKEVLTNVRHNDMFQTMYTQAQYRGTSYLPGLMAGMYVYLNRNEPLSKAKTYILQTTGVVCCLLVYWSGSLFYNVTWNHSRLVHALYAAFHHTIFGLALALFTISCTLGKTTWVSKLLSWKGFITVSRLSYCVYLVQFIPQLIWVASSRTAVHLNFLELISWSIADMVISLALALFLYLTIETPARLMVKYLISGYFSAPTDLKLNESKKVM